MSYVQWVTASEGEIPPGAEPAGFAKDGTPLYTGRAVHNDEEWMVHQILLVPAKVKPGVGAWVAWGGAEHVKKEYEVLVSCSTAWKYSRDGNVPDNAISVGIPSRGEEIFLGRGFYDGTVTPGKVQRSHGCLYISYNGQEIPLTEYEVLIQI